MKSIKAKILGPVVVLAVLVLVTSVFSILCLRLFVFIFWPGKMVSSLYGLF